LLWLKGGYKIIFGGPKYVGDYLSAEYRAGGSREFDAHFMAKVYEKPFEVETVDLNDVPAENESSKAIGRHLKGCRIGFDAGGSDRKVSAVIDGEAIYSEEVVWHPKLQSDPSYQYEGILDSMKTAAGKMPRVDAIGVSAAGIYIDNRVMAASLFIKVPQDVFDNKVKNMFFDIQREMGGVPIEVANDGDVTALAGAMSLEENRVLGIAMGTSEAAGYVDEKGNITGWLNELAFVPVDYNPSAMEDEWSGDIGCGVKYFSQDGVIKLAPNAGVDLDDSMSPADKLKQVQKLMGQGDDRARKIYQSIGCYLGYAIAYYAQFYDIGHVLLLGRVTSGTGGNILLDNAKDALAADFPELASKINIIIPDEKSRRVGQSVAAASLPEI
jgi:predicted NBD/HSP70 family sugar kinase